MAWIEEVLEAVPGFTESFQAAEERALAELEESALAVESEEEVAAFAEEITDPPPVDPPVGATIPRRFITWLAQVEGKTWINVGFQTTMVGIMLAPIIEKALDTAKNTQHRTCLDTAIKGAKQALVSNFSDSILTPAQKLKDSPGFSTLSAAEQQQINDTLNLGAEGFWVINGPTVMKAYSQSPVFDPTC